MDRAKQLQIFHWQTGNLRKLDSSFGLTRRCLNSALLKNDAALIELHTKTLAFIYCCWTEATFYKLIHTPHCFTLDEIRQLKLAVKLGGITQGWKKAINLAMRHLKSTRGDISNRKLKLERLLRQYIEEPSQLRNRIAHGQWVHALKNDGSDRNPELTSALADLDFLRIEQLKYGCTALAGVIESLFESPNRAFHRDYYLVLSQAESELERLAGFSVKERVDKLKRKRGQNQLVPKKRN